MNAKTMRNSFLLFLTACIWGLSFVSQSKGMEEMGALTFNGVRSLLGAAVVFPIVCYRVGVRKKEAEAGKGSKLPVKLTLAGGICCGIVYTAASTFQQYGVAHTTVGKAGFITTLYIIFVPILGIFLKKKVQKQVWIGALMAAVGMYLLCMTESFSLTPGDTLVFICAVLFAVHILIIDWFSPRTEGVALSCMQLFICGIFCTAGALLLEQPTWEQLQAGALPILYSGILSCGVAYTLQIVGQKGMNPTIAALILSLESVVAALAAFAAYKIGFLHTDQTLTLRQVLGCVIVFAAVILVQLPTGRKKHLVKTE